MPRTCSPGLWGPDVADLGKLFSKNGIAEQFLVWNVIAQLVTPILGPTTEAIAGKAWRDDPNLPLDAGVAAQAVARGLMAYGDGAHAAASGGVGGTAFKHLVDAAQHAGDLGPILDAYRRGLIDDDAVDGALKDAGVRGRWWAPIKAVATAAPDIGTALSAYRRGFITGERVDEALRDAGVEQSWWAAIKRTVTAPPDLSIAIEARRRGLIDEARLDEAIKAAGIEPSWWPAVRAMTVIPPSPAEALNALLEGQVDRATALKRYTESGGDPTWFQHAFDSQGQAPTPNEALELLNRGIIAERGAGPSSTSYEQAFLEGPWRNKWLGPFLALREYLPPPRTVTAMLRNGSLSVAQATDLFVKQGLSAELAAAYVNDATQTATATDKDLTQSQVIGLYESRIIARADALRLLEALNYDRGNAGYLIELADLRRVIAAVNAAVGRVHGLYVTSKITRAAAVNTLHELKVPAEQVSDLVRVWDLEASVTVKQLTESQIVAAFTRGLFTQAQATAELTAVGYTPLDAWVLLSTAHHEALPGRPAPGPAGPGVLP